MIKTCLYCGTEYHTEDKRQKYCCIEHAYKDRKSNKITVQCKNCGKNKEIFPSRLVVDKNFFCNKQCHDEYQKLHPNKGTGHPGKKRLARMCEYCKKTYHPSRGYTVKNGYQRFCSNSCRLLYLIEYQIGENNPSWKGGVTPERRALEGMAQYQEWRQKVYKRDKYCCAMCGSTKKICAHHIKTFADYSELRMDINNGITLCESCHNKTYSKELLFEGYFYNILSFFKEFSFYEVRLANALSKD